MFGIFITCLAVIFWLFRVVITFVYTSDIAFNIIPINLTFEIVLMFVTFLCIVLISKRKMLGAIGYLIVHIAYFGLDAYKNIELILNNETMTSTYPSLVVSIIAIIIPILAILDIGLNSGKKSILRDRNTDWFFNTHDYEREKDERADRNQYKF